MTDVKRLVGVNTNNLMGNWKKNEDGVLYLPAKKEIELPMSSIVLVEQLTENEFNSIRNAMKTSGGKNR